MPRGRRRDDRRDLQAVPRQGDQRDPPPRARGRGRRGRAPRSPSRRATRSGTIFLLKYGPQAQELQEGVAFHGRAGHALKRSLERLHVDPSEVFGTNCVKFAGADDGDVPRLAARASCGSCSRGCVVVMGDDALEFLNELAFPLSQPLERYAGRAAALHADDRGARRPRHRLGARRAAREDALLERLQARRALVGRAAAVLDSLRSRALIAWYEARAARATGGRSGRASCSSRSSLMPGDVPARLARAAARATRRGLLAGGGAGLLVLAVVLWQRRPRRSSRTSASSARARSSAGGSSGSSRSSRGSCSSRALIPWVDAYSVWRGPTKRSPSTTSRSSAALGRVRRPRRRLGRARPARPVLLRRSSSRRSVRFGLRPFWTWLGMVAASSLTMICATWWDLRPAGAARASRSASCSRTPTCSGGGCRAEQPAPAT